MSDNVLEDTLKQAMGMVTGTRAQEYGGTVHTHERIGQMWAAVLDLDEPIPPGKVAAMMVSLKLIRSTSSPGQDSWIDAAGYAAIGAECTAQANAIARPALWAPAHDAQPTTATTEGEN